MSEFQYNMKLCSKCSTVAVPSVNLSGICVISGFCREVDENCALLGYYAASSGNSLRTFRGNLSVPSSRANGPIGCPEKSVTNYQYSLRNDAEERSSLYPVCWWKRSSCFTMLFWPGQSLIQFL